MAYLIISLLVAVPLLVVLPGAMELILKRPTMYRSLLVAASLLFFFSWFVPSPRIDGQFTAFSTHFVGGGLFTGFVWLYLVKNLGWKLSPAMELLTLYFLVCGLGVANELFELAVVRAGYINLTLADTTWDLVANTLGALAFWLAYRLWSLATQGHQPPNNSAI